MATPSASPAPGSPVLVDRKRKRKHDEEAGSAASKKERKQKRTRQKRENNNNDNDDNDENENGNEDDTRHKRKSKHRDASPSNRHTPSPPPPPLPPNTNPSKSALQTKKRVLRKSVSFTADTKATDGDSIKTLYDNHDPFAHYASYQQHISDYPTNELPAGFDDDEPRPEEVVKGKHERFHSPPPATKQPSEKKKQKNRERREKKQKKKEAKEDAEDEASGAEFGTKLAYLLTYHTSRDTWRFEKAKQNWILRHAFDPAKIPDEGYGAALKSYITGLLSPAARDRLLAEANEIVKRGKDTISKDGEKLNPEDQKTNVIRAKLVLSALGHEDDEDDEDDEESSGGESSDDDE